MSYSFLDKIDIELLDSNIQEIENCFNSTRALIRPEIQDPEVLKLLESRINSGDLERISKGLVYGILAGMDWTKFLFIGNQDLLHSSCITFASLVPVLKSRHIGMGLFIKLWKVNCSGFNDLFLTFLRTYDFVYELKSELDWVCNSPFLSLIFYKIVRQATIAASEGSPTLSDYTYLMTYLWRHKRDSCLAIGRDLMRIISPLSEVNGLELIWNDLFSPSRDGSPLYWSLLCTPTHPRFHSVLLVPSLESKLVYVIENASSSNYTRYLKWIIDTYDENIIADVVRFITTFPSSVESTPRWQIIAWLLTCTSDHQLQANIKQALIFDCLFYNQQDQVCTIEPLMSILKFSISRVPQVAEEILEFLLTSAELYDKRSVAGMMRSLRECFTIAYYHRLIPNLESIMSDERIDSSIRGRLSDLWDSSCSGSEPSQSPIHDEETPPNTPRSYEIIGELSNDFTIDPSFEKLMQILEKNPVTKELAVYVLKCISHEFIIPIVPELHRNSVFYQIFAKAEQDEKLTELLKLLAGLDNAIGIRLLIYTIQTKSNLYFRFEYNLEKDLKACNDEVSLDTLNWIFPSLLQKQKIAPKILSLFLSSATPELFFHTELELRFNNYKLLTSCLDEALSLSVNMSSTEKIYLWRLITAEIPISKAQFLIDFCTSSYSSENWSGLLDYFRVHSSHITIEVIQIILTLPLHLCSTVAVLINRVSFSTVI